MVWNNITLADKAYDATHFALAFVYLCVMSVSLYMVLRLHFNGRLHAWSQLFHFFLLSGSLVRAVFFCLQPFVLQKSIRMPNQVNTVLNTLPSFFYFSDYTIVLSKWVEIYHSSRAVSRRLRIAFLCSSIIVYVTLIILYALDFALLRMEYALYSYSMNVIEIAVYTLTAALFVITALAFLIYGTLIYLKVLYGMPIARRTAHTVSRRIQIVTILVSVCFVLRGAIILLQNYGPWDSDWIWWLDVVYFICLEVAPLVAMLFILHRDPQTHSHQLTRNLQAEVSPLLAGRTAPLVSHPVG